jgi:hypothetical protein
MSFKHTSHLPLFLPNDIHFKIWFPPSS